MAIVDNHISATEAGVRLSEATPRDYFALLKPRVMSLVIFTALVGLVAAP
ncbi:MAG: protoheme IX farnesyltransferase, partial [Nitratireductor sp.]